jgi:hypothetical protein
MPFVGLLLFPDPLIGRIPYELHPLLASFTHPSYRLVFINGMQFSHWIHCLTSYIQVSLIPRAFFVPDQAQNHSGYFHIKGQCHEIFPFHIFISREVEGGRITASLPASSLLAASVLLALQVETAKVQNAADLFFGFSRIFTNYSMQTQDGGASVAPRATLVGRAPQESRARRASRAFR